MIYNFNPVLMGIYQLTEQQGMNTRSEKAMPLLIETTQLLYWF